MKQIVRLEMPQIFDNFFWPYFSRRQRDAILKAAKEAEQDLDFQPNIAVIVRTKNDREALRTWVKHIESERKSYNSRIDLIVVDTESVDGTVEIAKNAKATLVNISQKDFSYPKGINIGFEAVKPDVKAAFITVGHAYPAATNCLQAAARHFIDPKAVAVYSDAVPNTNATNWEKSMYYFAWPVYHRLKQGAHTTKKWHGGLTQGTNSMVRLATWRNHPFDEAYAHGGEDLAWGKWALKTKHQLIYDPAVVVHHSHGLGFINLVRQLKYWIYISLRKGEFKQHKVHRYRPDLRSK